MQSGTIMLITINDIPPSNNKFIGRKNIWEYQRYKKEWAMLVRAGINMAEMPKEPYKRSEIHIHYIFPTRTRHDPDNYAGKLLLDPLTANGIIADDNFNAIRLVLTAEYKKGVKCTQISVKSLN